MIRWVVESSMKLRFLVIVLALLLLIFGFAQLRQMPVAVYPEIDPPHVEIQTEALGLSAEEIEAMLTDQAMQAKLAATSKHMQAQKGTEKAAKILDSLLQG